MTTIRFRPTFNLVSERQRGELEQRLRSAVADHDDVSGQFKDGHASISIVDSKRHFWSPWLNLELREIDDQNHLFGRFSPHPSIWTAIMFSYLAVGVLTFFSAIVGWSQQLAGERPFGYYLIPVWILIAVGLWLVSQVGQQLALREMQMMKQMILDSLE
ncbi:hypothetical protein [Mariniblastus fucicola]|uniref:Uncharacterized protein n=1 Tax=Mariniblastus fucicola TaxID=980251 RepID=A0A5B9PG07_9BACT|nr:hypothetical protein [Mariniblastus fucicola]QEG21881.1 hypothetical protein MFFC18_17420 [Mariniblastus fucicola]